MALAALSAGTVALAAGAYDIRGWPVHTLVDGCLAGSVHDLLLDAQGRVRWLDVDVGTRRHVLLPAGQARAAPAARRLWAPGLVARQLARLPAYDHLPALLDDARQRQLLDAFAASLLRQRSAPPPPEPSGNVVALSALPEYRVASGDTDPRGWTVTGAGDQRLARVEDLLVDPDMLRVRHLVCRPEGAQHLVLLPVGYARLDGGARAVHVPRLTRELLDALPRWGGADGAAAAASARLPAPAPEEDPRLDPVWLFGPPS